MILVKGDNILQVKLYVGFGNSFEHTLIFDKDTQIEDINSNLKNLNFKKGFIKEEIQLILNINPTLF